MSVNKYSLKADGRKHLSADFTVSEFACRDGSDDILIDSDLVETLQKIRSHFGKPLHVTSGYRTPGHDKAVGGSGKGYHTKGMAADIWVSDTDICKVAYYADEISDGLGGLELAPFDGGDYLHIDTRKGRWRALLVRTGNGYENFGRLFPNVKIGSDGQGVCLLQKMLDKFGFECAFDGKFGNETEGALKKYQKANGLEADGICGPLTWKNIIEKL
jgi:peptidoglycan hydrolase-like protein with peptidoglycan-binding domain